jgi:DNA-binding MarR family transcriptional regulator
VPNEPAAALRLDPTDRFITAWEAQLPAEVSTSFEFLRRVARVAGLLEAAMQPHLARAGLARAEYDILGTLRSAPPNFQLRPGELARRITLTTGGTSKSLRRLEARGLITRAKDETDGRGTVVALTDEGREIVERTVRAVVRASADLFRPVAQHLPAANETLRTVLSGLEPDGSA